MGKLGQVINVDKEYIENLISKHGSVREAHFETRPLSEYEHDNKVAFEVPDGSAWTRRYDKDLFPMYVEKCRTGDRIIFGHTHALVNGDSQTVYHHYRWLIQDYGKLWRMREIIDMKYDYSKAMNLFKR